MKELLQLFALFSKIGCFTFGGGYAMLPMIQRELVEKRNWCTKDEIIDYYAIGQLTPGVIAVNISTFVGYKRRGAIGGIIATLGLIFPSIIIISIIASLIKNFAELYVVQCAFAGIRVVVLALIVDTIINMTKAGVKDWLTFIILVTTFGLMMIDVSAVLIIIGAALLGFLYKRTVKKP